MTSKQLAAKQLYSSSRINILESEGPELHALSNHEYSTFHIVLDSGSADHVVDSVDIPGYSIEERIGSKAGACFVAANWERIPNRDQVNLQMRSGNIRIKSTFQALKISKLLWSVGKLCDAGYRVEFKKESAKVVHESTGKEVGTFPRSQGLYIGQLQLKNPQTFHRQA